MTPSKTRLATQAAGPRSSTTGRASALESLGPSPRLSSSIFVLTVHYTQPNVGEVQNVLHCRADTEPTGDLGDILDDLNVAFLDACQDELLACMAQDCTLSAYSSRRLTGGSPTVTHFVGNLGLGIQPVDNTAIACNISFIPSDAPWNYGHFYVPCVPDDAMNGNQFQSGYLTKVDALAEKLTSQWSHTGGTLGLKWQAVIYSRKLDTSRTIARWIRQSRPVAIGRRLRPWVLGF